MLLQQATTQCQRGGSWFTASSACPTTVRQHRQQQSGRRGAAVIVCAKQGQGQQSAQSVQEELRRMESDRVRLRSEAEAPWRSLRLVLYGFSVASAGMGTLISLPQLAGALGGAPGALTTETVLQNLAINLGAVGIFGFLFSRDMQARDKQMARLAREEALANQQVQLSNGKRIRLADLQGTSRVVLAAGTTQQVAEALAAAEPFKEQLMRRGVLVVPLPIFPDKSSSSSSNGSSSNGSSSSETAAAAATIPALKPEDLRWRVNAINLDAWRTWFDEQLVIASKANADRGLYIGLRLDGRTRASGMGSPPWARFAVELAPLEGDNKWTGWLDGFDGDSAVR